MGSHVYCKHIDNKNIQGFIVKGIGFKKLFDAEEYCARLELPPTKDFLVYNPSEAKRLSLTCERELKFVVDLLEDAQKKAKEKLDVLCAKRDRIRSKEKINVMDKCELDVLNDNIQNAIGEHSGLIDAILIVRKRAYEHWELSRLNQEVTKDVETT